MTLTTPALKKSAPWSPEISRKPFPGRISWWPRLAAPAPKIGDSALDHLQTYLADIYTIPANLAGLPAMSIPCGTVRESGMELPVGFQMMAPHFREDLLLKTGFALGK